MFECSPRKSKNPGLDRLGDAYKAAHDEDIDRLRDRDSQRRRRAEVQRRRWVDDIFEFDLLQAIIKAGGLRQLILLAKL